MQIRLATSNDREFLLDVWLRSVNSTHHFVSQDDITEMIPLVREYLRSLKPEFWILCDSTAVMGFMGMSGSKIDSLFLVPEFQRRGAGRKLVQHAQDIHGELTVDVNEQNTSALAFYEALGFKVEGRSAQDEQGRPYPLLHLRLPAPKPNDH